MSKTVKLRVVAGVLFLVVVLRTCSPDRATWYGAHSRGHRMANNRLFDPNAMTAASWDYPVGAKLKLMHDRKSVIVEVTDRGGEPAFLQFGKTVDLTRAAFAKLEDPKEGSVRVKIRRIK